MRHFKLHEFIAKNDLAGLRDAFARESVKPGFDIDEYDKAGYTPLMRSVMGPEEDPAIVEFLLDHGADMNLKSREQYDPGSLMVLALGGGSPSIIALLMRRGGNIHYTREHNYNALVDTVHSRDILTDTRLVGLLELLITNGVDLNVVTSYGESGLRVLSRIGRFDAIGVLLDAGADASHLGWTPLMRTIALGTLEDVKREVEAGGSLRDKDHWERTPWLLSLQTGEITKVSYLYEVGGDLSMRGRCNKPPLLFAVESRNAELVRWLINIGVEVDQRGDSEDTALTEAIAADNLKIVEILIEAGADLHRERYGEAALGAIQSREMANLLLAAGADPTELRIEGQRVMLGLNSATGIFISQEDFDHGWSRRFGVLNPEMIEEKFWEYMIRTGMAASTAAEDFECGVLQQKSPIWCAQRFGQSITFMPDGRTIQIGGEHEDFYDKDFCIYNDTFIHHPSGQIEIFGYPAEIFPPTDFHTATLIGRAHYLVNRGSWLCGNSRLWKNSGSSFGHANDAGGCD
jgi:ankyrin repeat protein